MTGAVERRNCKLADIVTAREVRHCLSERENLVITLLFDRGWIAREVADQLNVNESRVSQIKRASLAKLRHACEKGNAARAA